MIIADLPPQITLECHGDRSGGLRGSAPFRLTVYVDVPRRRFLTAPTQEFGWPRHGNLKSVANHKMVLWNFSENSHPFLQSFAEFDLKTQRYVGRIKYNARALIDEKYSGTCTVRHGVPAPIRKTLQNA